MLSIVDIKRELGENIYVYPVHPESIKSNSMDLHVSKYAWSLKSKEFIGNDKYIIIDPSDTALIYSEESIYVSHKIGGAYNSKVTLVSKGAGHIGTTLDAQYIGCSLVAIHNHSSEQLKLKVGSEFVTLHFWYLYSPDYEKTQSHDNEPGHSRMLNGFSDVDKYIEWRNQNTWTTRKKDLFHKMLESNEYKRCKEEFQKELDIFNKNLVKKRTKKYVCVILVVALVLALIIIPTYFMDLGEKGDSIKNIVEKIVFPIAVAVLTTYVITDIKINK